MLASEILTYQELLHDSPEPVRVRLAMVKRYKEISNISQVAREFKTTRQTVRKWVERFQGSLSSLRNLSRAPQCPFRRMAARTEALLIAFKKAHPALGYDYIHHYLLKQGCKEIPSRRSVYAVWRKADLLPKRQRKREKKRDLRAIKARYRPFQKMQIDVKELRDIPNILEQALALQHLSVCLAMVCKSLFGWVMLQGHNTLRCNHQTTAISCSIGNTSPITPPAKEFGAEALASIMHTAQIG